MEGMIAVGEMTVRYPAVVDGLRNMVECLRDKKKGSNIKIVAVVVGV